MRVLLEKCDGSAGVKISVAVPEAACSTHGQIAEVQKEDGRVVIKPIRPMRYHLDGLLAGVSGENRHEPVDFGVPVGREAW